MSAEPREGEWWWVEIESDGVRDIEAARKDRKGRYWSTPAGLLEMDEVRPIRRINDEPPPAPEPSEAEKIDALLQGAYLEAISSSEGGVLKVTVGGAAKVIRQHVEAAGYVLVPTSGPGFQRMVDDLMDGILKDCGGRVWDMTAADLIAPLRATLERWKGVSGE